jgi:ribosomal protein S18 acetylase RimI-like enzyme
VLDLRHFPAAQLRPLLEDQARRWEKRLRWNYRPAVEMLLEYVHGRILPGYVALRGSRAIGYTFWVAEATKAVVGDLYAYDEGEGIDNPVCETLAHHLLETLQATPGIDRIESQLLMFPAGALAGPFGARGFRTFPRTYLVCDLTTPGLPAAAAEPPRFRLAPWRDELYESAGELIHRTYVGHIDSEINDGYCSVSGSVRFLHNIVRFPGCGEFDPANSWVLQNTRTGRLEGLLLSSMVRFDSGHITQLCVAPEARGQGLGRALLDRTIAGFRRRGVGFLTLTVTDANREAMRLYTGYGFLPLHRFEAMVWHATAS